MKNLSYNPFTLLFRDRETELSFLRKSLKHQKIQILFLLIPAAVTVGMSAWRQISSGDGEWIFLVQKLFLVALFLFQIFYPFEKNNRFQLKEGLLVLTGALSLIFVALKFQTDVDITGNMFFGIVILQLVAIFLLFGIKFFYSLFIGALFALTYELSPLFFEISRDIQNPGTNKLMVYSALIISAAALYVNEKQKRDNYRVNILLTQSNNKLQEFSDELSQNEQTIKLVLEQIPELIISISSKGDILFWNRKCESVTGYTFDQVEGKDGFAKLFPDKNIRQKNIRMFTSDKMHSEFESRIIDIQGNKRIISWKRIKPYTYISDTPFWYAGTDITEEFDTWKELQRIEQKLKQTQDLALIGTWEWEPATGKIEWSEQMYKMFGEGNKISEDDASRIFSGLLHEESLRKLANDVLEIGKEKHSKFVHEYTLTLNKNEKKVMYIQGQIIYNEKGRIIKVYGTNQDITAIKQTESKLISIQKSLEYAQKIAKLGNIEYIRNTEEVYISKEVNRILETGDTIYRNFPKSLERFFNTDDYDYIYRFMIESADEEYSFEKEMTIESGGGKTKILSVMANTYHDGENRLVHSLILQDNTELRHAINALEDSKLKIQNILSSSPDPILVIDNDFIIQDTNNAAETIFGLPHKDLFYKPLKDFFEEKCFHAFCETASRLDNQMNTVKNIEFTMKRIGGDSFPAEISLALIPGSAIHKRLYVAVTKDITSRKIYEENLNEARERAEEADKLKSAFLANMSHEIRTPMNAIVGFSRMLTQPELSESERAEFSGYIASNSAILLTLIDDIIDISKIEAGQLKIKYRYTSFNEICDEVMTIAAEQRKMYKKHDLKIINKCSGNLTDAPVKLDKTRVIQVFTNLVTNAVKFTEKGQVTCRCEIVKMYDKKFIKFTVEDTGIGIKRESIDKIFNQFYRVESNNSFEYRGTGLGLALSKRLLSLMGGKIEVESDAGKGSTFSFYIPYVAGKVQEEQIISGKKISKRPDWKDKKIIIAEDDHANYKYLELLFASTGLKIIHAPDGRSAIDFFQSEPDIDLILMDIRMPGIDGYEATEKIKSMKSDVPIIAVTAFAMSGEKQEIMSYPFDDYVSKPVNSEELIQKMNRFLSKNHTNA